MADPPSIRYRHRPRLTHLSVISGPQPDGKRARRNLAPRHISPTLRRYAEQIFAIELIPDDRRDVIEVRVRGDVDLATSPRLRSAFVDLHQRGCHHLEVDLGGVEFLDSTGIGVLIGALRRARQAGGELHLLALSPELDRLFALLGLGAVFGIAPPVDKAL